MNGSEKQIKWAEEIKAIFLLSVAGLRDRKSTKPGIWEEPSTENLALAAELEGAAETKVDAGFWITNRRDLTDCLAAKDPIVRRLLA